MTVTMVVKMSRIVLNNFVYEFLCFYMIEGIAYQWHKQINLRERNII